MTDLATIDSIAPGPEQEAAARSTLYRHLADWLRFPWENFHGLALAGELAQTAAPCLAALPYTVEGADGMLESLGEVEADYDLFQSDYVGLFDVGAGGPPCPLYGGVWGGDRQKVMEEALRFYRFFGLSLSPEERDLPDHVSTELEFLHFLTFKEVEALREGSETDSLRRAARDFLVRHPAKWLPRAAGKLQTKEAPRFWRGLIGLGALFCKADADYLITTEGPVRK